MHMTFEEFQNYTPDKPTFALFGWPLGHTMSPELHAHLFATDRFDARYVAVAVPPDKLSEAFALAREKLHGINLTIPHKQAVIPLLDELEKGARDLGSVNTVSFLNGRATGYNTDILGFAASLERDGVALPQKKVLLLGYGGAAAVMGYHCAQAGATLVITGRAPEKAEALAQRLRTILPQAKIAACTRRKIPKDAQIVINGTPLGMFPQETLCPLRFLPHKTEYVFDAIYNPPVTSTMKLARSRKTRTRDGLYMLVMQAAHAQAVWTGRSFTTAECDAILRTLYGQMAVRRLREKHQKQNIVLCGFMGSGKTTAGRKIARLTGLSFVDADQYLEEQEGMRISDIFSRYGEAYFRNLETHYIQTLAQRQGIVLALGGGAVLRPENVAAVKASGFLIHLDTPFYRIVKNLSYSSGRPLLEQGDKMAQTRKLYNQRKNSYRSVADQAVRSPRLTDLVLRVIQSI